MNKDFWQGCLMCLAVWFVYPMIFIWILNNRNTIFSQICLMLIGLALASYFFEWLRGKVN